MNSRDSLIPHYDPLEANKEANKLIVQLISGVYLASIVTITVLLFDRIRAVSSVSSGFFVKQMGVFLALTIISIQSIIFFHRFISKIKDSKLGEGFSVTLVVSLCILLIATMNFPFYFLVGIGVLLILGKVYQLNHLLVKEANVGSAVKIYFQRLIAGYMFMAVIILGFGIYLDITNYQIIPTHQDGMVTVQLKQLLSSPSISDVTKQKMYYLIDTQAKEMDQLRTSNSITLSTSVYFVIIAILYAMYKGLLSRSVENEAIIDELRVYYNTTGNNGINDFSKKDDDNGSKIIKSIIPFLIIVRPLMSAVSGVSALSVYFYVAKGFCDFKVLIGLFFIVFMTSAFGFVLNDFFDSEKDRHRNDQRMIPSGMISLKAALSLSILLFILSLSLSLFLNRYVFLINLATLSLLSIYSRINNRYGFAANIITALNSSFVIIIGMMASGYDYKMLFLAGSVFSFIVGREIFLDIRDLASDKKIGKKSLPLSYGEKAAIVISGIFFTISSIVTISLSFVIGSLSFVFCIGLLFNILLWYFYTLYCMKRNSESLEEFLLSTRIAFLLIVPGLIV